MNRMLNEIPEITQHDVDKAIARAHRERSDFIAAALRGLVQRLRPRHKASAPNHAIPC